MSTWQGWWGPEFDLPDFVVPNVAAMFTTALTKVNEMYGQDWVQAEDRVPPGWYVISPGYAIRNVYSNPGSGGWDLRAVQTPWQTGDVHSGVLFALMIGGWKFGPGGVLLRRIFYVAGCVVWDAKELVNEMTSTDLAKRPELRMPVAMRPPRTWQHEELADFWQTLQAVLWCASGDTAYLAAAGTWSPIVVGTDKYWGVVISITVGAIEVARMQAVMVKNDTGEPQPTAPPFLPISRVTDVEVTGTELDRIATALEKLLTMPLTLTLDSGARKIEWPSGETVEQATAQE